MSVSDARPQLPPAGIYSPSLVPKSWCPEDAGGVNAGPERPREASATHTRALGLASQWVLP